MHFQMFALCGAMAVVSTSRAGLVDMVGELTGVNAIAAVPGQPDYPDTITLRIYAVLASGGDTLDTIHGTSDHPILVAASSMFYQNVFGGPTSVDIDADQFSVFPDLAYDSWITIGASSMVDNALSATGTSFTAFEGGSPLYAPAGVWSVPDGSAQGQPVLEDGRWRVLVGQFSLFGTLNASLQLQWNMSGNEANGGRWNAGGAWTFNGVPAPGAMAVLGLGCLVGRRRRR